MGTERCVYAHGPLAGLGAAYRSQSKLARQDADEINSYAEAGMSYQAQDFVRRISGVSRGEKALLMALSYYHDSRNNSCRASYAELALDCGITERHAIRLTVSLADRKVISVRPNNVGGRGKKSEFQFVGMPVKTTKKGDICGTQRVTFAASANAERVTFEAQKGDIRDSVIRNEVNQVEMMIKGSTSSSADDGRSLTDTKRVIELFELSPATRGKPTLPIGKQPKNCSNVLRLMRSNPGFYSEAAENSDQEK